MRAWIGQELMGPGWNRDGRRREWNGTGTGGQGWGQEKCVLGEGAGVCADEGIRCVLGKGWCVCWGGGEECAVEGVGCVLGKGLGVCWEGGWGHGVWVREKDGL